MFNTYDLGDQWAYHIELEEIISDDEGNALLLDGARFVLQRIAMVLKERVAGAMQIFLLNARNIQRRFI